MLKLLIVEDEKNILEEMIEAFERAGYTAFKAVTGKEALQVIREQKPEIVILDLYLEDMSGLLVLQEAKVINPKICVMVLTGFDQEFIKEKAFQTGADYFLIKPIPLAVLKEYVSQAARNITKKDQ